jgi:serine/threonine protein phosphatase 1
MAIALGDIHGCSTALLTMLELIQPSKTELIITLGDYVDRGPNSCAVIDTLLELKQSHRYIHLMGNHEIQMIRALESPQHMQRFLSPLCGGQETLASYGGNFDGIPDKHWEFIKSSELYHETDSHIFVHACSFPPPN